MFKQSRELKNGYATHARHALQQGFNQRSTATVAAAKTSRFPTKPQL